MSRSDSLRWAGIGVVAAYLVVLGARAPQHAWNDVRLAAASMVWDGPAFGPYAPEGGGPVSTWIYGPASLIWWSPAAAIRSVAGALTTAFAINALTLIPGLFYAIRVASEHHVGAREVGLALFLVIALWPRFGFEYLVADNLGLAAALVSIALLLRPTPLIGGAAICTGIAILSKQTMLPLAIAQVVWMAARHSSRASLRLCGGITATVGIGLAATLIGFGATAVHYNLVTIPAAVPWGAPLAKLAPIEHWPYVILLVIVPLLSATWTRSRWWHPTSSWSLPVWSMLALFPGSIAGFFKVGGSVNSLAAVLIVFPSVAVFISTSRYRTAATIGAAGWMICQAGFVGMSAYAHRGGLSSGIELVQAYRGRIHLPWHPLLQAKTEGVYYHAEDGLLTRLAAGSPYSPATLAANQPHAGPLILAYDAEDPLGYLTSFLPVDSSIVQIGSWTLYASPPAPTP